MAGNVGLKGRVQRTEGEPMAQPIAVEVSVGKAQVMLGKMRFYILNDFSRDKPFKLIAKKRNLIFQLFLFLFPFWKNKPQIYSYLE